MPAPDARNGARLDHPERSMFAEVAALVPPVMGGRVLHHEVGCRPVVEHLGDVLEGMGVGVGPAPGVGDGPLVGHRGEPCGVLAGDGVLAPHQLRFERPPQRGIRARLSWTPTKAQMPVDRGHVVLVAGRGPGDEVDDRPEVGSEQHVEGSGPNGVVGRRDGEGGRRIERRQREGKLPAWPIITGASLGRRFGPAWEGTPA